MTHFACSACGLQFESRERSVRCPSCGTRVRTASGTLPPLPAGLQHHSTATTPHREHGDFQASKFWLAMAYAFVGVLLLILGLLNGEAAAAGVGAAFAVLVVLNGYATSMWHYADGDGLRGLLIELPLYIILLGSLLAGFGVLALGVYALLQVSPVALLVLVPLALLLRWFAPAHMAWAELLLRLPTHPGASRPTGIEDASKSGRR